MTRQPEIEHSKLIGREVYVGGVLVGRITGERCHPRGERVSSMRMKVEDDVAEEYMRKPAESAPLSKELVHSIRTDGGVTLSIRSCGELQRRWRNTVRIDKKLYAPDELLDRAVLDNDGMDLGNVTGLVEIKRVFKGLVIQPHYIMRSRHGIPETIVVPVGQLARTTARLDEIILRCSTKRLVTLPSFLKLNEKYTGAPRGRPEPTYEHPNPFSAKQWKTLDKMGAGFLLNQHTNTTQNWHSGPYTETINIHQARKLHERIFGALISLPTSYEVDPKSSSHLEYNEHLITWTTHLTDLHRAFGSHLTDREDCETASRLSTAPRGPLGTSIIPDIYPISREIHTLKETMSLNLSSLIYPHKKLTSFLLNVLKEERLNIAKKEGIPPYLIFHNVALEAMAIELPTNMDELLELPQVGPKNSEKYGRIFLDLIPDTFDIEQIRNYHSPFSGVGNFTLLENKHFSDHPAGQVLGLTNSLLLIPPLQEFRLKKRSSSDGDGPSPTYSRKIEDMELLRTFSQGVSGLWGEAIALFNLGVLSWSGYLYGIKKDPVDLLQESLSKFRKLTSGDLVRGGTESTGSFGVGMLLDIKRDEWKTLEELINVLRYRKFEGDLEWVEELSKEKDAISATFDFELESSGNDPRWSDYGDPGGLTKPANYYSRKGSEVLSSQFDPRTSRFPTHRLGGISDEKTPTVYFELLDRVVAEFDHNAPDALTNLESQLNEISLPDDSSLQSLPLSELFGKLDRSNLIRVNLVLETRDGYLICREFENSLSVTDSRGLPHLDSQLVVEVERGDINWSSWVLGSGGLKFSSSLHPRLISQKSESLGLIADIEEGLSCNHFSRTILNHSVDELNFHTSLASGFRAYYIGLDAATRQINLCHLIDHLFDRRIADNKLLTALHLLLLEAELRPEAETSQQEANPLDRPIKPHKQNPQ